MNDNVEQFYNSIPWRVKEGAQFPANFCSMNPEQRRLVTCLYEFENTDNNKQSRLQDISSDAHLIAEEAKTVANELAELCENLKKV